MAARWVTIRDVAVAAGVMAGGAALVAIRQLLFHPERPVWPQMARIAASFLAAGVIALAALWVERRRRATAEPRPEGDRTRDPAV